MEIFTLLGFYFFTEDAEQSQLRSRSSYCLLQPRRWYGSYWHEKWRIYYLACDVSKNLGEKKGQKISDSGYQVRKYNAFVYCSILEICIILIFKNTILCSEEHCNDTSESWNQWVNCGACVITLIPRIERKKEVHEDKRKRSVKNQAVPQGECQMILPRIS